MAGVFVHATSVDDTSHVRPVETDPSGNVELLHVPAGQFTVRCMAMDRVKRTFNHASVPVTVQEGAAMDMGRIVIGADPPPADDEARATPASPPAPPSDGAQNE